MSGVSSRTPGAPFKPAFGLSGVLPIHYSLSLTKRVCRALRGLLREARILAAEAGTSISAMLAAQLEQAVLERRGYQEARRRALARLKRGYELKWKPARSRDELHER